MILPAGQQRKLSITWMARCGSGRVPPISLRCSPLSPGCNAGEPRLAWNRRPGPGRGPPGPLAAGGHDHLRLRTDSGHVRDDHPRGAAQQPDPQRDRLRRRLLRGRRNAVGRPGRVPVTIQKTSRSGARLASCAARIPAIRFVAQAGGGAPPRLRGRPPRRPPPVSGPGRQSAYRAPRARAAELLSLTNGGEARSLNRLAELAAWQVPACAGAHAAVWRDGELVAAAATHPDLAELADLQLSTGRGPLVATEAGAPVSCPDLLTDARWPQYAEAALRRGVRCSVHLVREVPHGALVLSLFGVRPGVLDAQSNPMADTLAAFGRAMLANATAYSQAQRTATQLKDAVVARSSSRPGQGNLDARARL